MDLLDLTDRTALVTGASGGIGAAVARLLHRYGARVILTGTRSAALAALRQELGARSHVVAADLAQPAAADSLVLAARAAAGPIGILVNHAGVSRREPTMTTTDAAWSAVLEVNLNAAFRLSRAVLPDMVEQHWGRVIGISSILAATGSAGMGAYAASKAGMIGLTKSLAAEFAGAGITVNCIAPGYIRTPMMARNPPELLDQLLSRIPAGFFGEPDDVAAAVLYLASPAARFVTGETLHVNGGMAMF